MSSQAYWEERHTDLPAMRAVGSINHSVAYNRWLYRVRRRVFSRALKELGLRPTRVLDVGSGTGFYVEQWQRMGVREIVVSDIAEPAVRSLEERFPELEVHQLDICAPTDLHGFDAVSAFDVLFHIVDDDAYAVALANIRNALRPGGVFLFSEHLPHAPISSRSHRVSRTLADVTSQLDESGLNLVLRRPTFRLMYPPLEPERYRVLDFLWRRRLANMVRSERMGLVLGAMLYPLEVLATRWMTEGPHTHLLAARKEH